MPSDDDLYECLTCSAKPGSPNLCERCIAARASAGNAWRGPRPMSGVYPGRYRALADLALTWVEIESGDEFRYDGRHVIMGKDREYRNWGWIERALTLGWIERIVEHNTLTAAEWGDGLKKFVKDNTPPTVWDYLAQDD